MKLLKHYKAYSLGLYAFLVFIHFILKDRVFPVSIIFYATPLILIILYGFFTTTLFWKKKVIFFVLIASQSILSFYWLSNYYFIQTIKTPRSKVDSILFWNAAKQQLFDTAPILESTKKFNNNIIALVEANCINQNEIDILEDNLPGYHFVKLKGGMFIGVKGTIKSTLHKYKKYRYDLNYIVATVNNIETRILITDVNASPSFNKKEPLLEILDYAKEKSVDFIVGDFNTPYESIHFSEYKESYSSFHGYGDGFSATWPHNIPLLELDQVWITKSLKPYCLKTTKYNVSDHKLLIAEYLNN